jgi:hypothetical protein
VILHVGGASTASIIVSILVIFFFIFALSFAFGPIPEGSGLLSGDRLAAWFRASLPRIAVAATFAAALGVGAVFLGDDPDEPDNSANASSCDTPLAPFTGNPVTEERLVTGADGWRQIAAAAAADDIDRVRTLYYTLDAHNLTHDLDRPFREADGNLARDLCLAVIVVENQMTTALDTTVIARESQRIAEYLEDALGYPSIWGTGTPVLGGGVCDRPLGAVTDQPLTAERLLAAVDTFRQVGGTADSAPPEEVRTLFFADAHNITHDIDGPLRAADADLAVDLCEDVLVLERELAGEFDPAVVQASADGAADTLEASGRALGILQ